MTTELPARAVTFTCTECERSYGSEIAAARCAALDLAGDD